MRDDKPVALESMDLARGAFCVALALSAWAVVFLIGFGLWALVTFIAGLF